MTGIVARFNRPLYLVKRGGYYSIHGTVDGKRIRVATGTADERRAQDTLQALQLSMDHGVHKDMDELDLSWRAVARAARKRHQLSAQARGMTFRLTDADVYRLLEQADFRCSLSGVPFTRRERAVGQPDPWSFSIDRIENAHGYVPGNVRAVSLVANIAMNRWGHDVLLRLAQGVMRNAMRPALPEPELTKTDTDGAENAA